MATNVDRTTTAIGANRGMSASPTLAEALTILNDAAALFVTRDGLIYVSDWNAGLNVLEYRG